jgi:hypothetical protein
MKNAPGAHSAVLGGAERACVPDPQFPPGELWRALWEMMARGAARCLVRYRRSRLQRSHSLGAPALWLPAGSLPPVFSRPVFEGLFARHASKISASSALISV